jgi:hypothetical protein
MQFSIGRKNILKHIEEKKSRHSMYSSRAGDDEEAYSNQEKNHLAVEVETSEMKDSVS